MIEGCIYIPEDLYMRLNRELRFCKCANTVLFGICVALGYFIWANNERNEKAG